MKPIIYTGLQLNEFSHGERFAAFVMKDGRSFLGKAVVDTSRVDRPPNRYFQGGRMHPKPENVSSWCLLGDGGQGPEETWPIWQDASTLPKKGSKIVYWDTLKCRKGYSGPYWHLGEFGTENYRFQGASGPFVSGEPWTLVKSWATLEGLITWLGLEIPAE